jgi:hypothetical protein
MSKKVTMLIGTIIGDCLVLILYHFWPEIPSDVVQWVVGGISGTGVGGLLGQGIADGMSRGLTSSQSGSILAAQLEKKVSASEPPAR